MRSVRRETVAKLLACVSLLLLAAMLGFRAFIYSRMYLAPGDPYGVSDLIEFALGLLLMLALAGSAVAAAWLAFVGRRERLVACWLGVVVAAVALSAGPLHNLVARWASA